MRNVIYLGLFFLLTITPIFSNIEILYDENDFLEFTNGMQARISKVIIEVDDDPASINECEEEN